MLTITSCNQHNNDAANKTSTFTVEQVATSLDWMSIDEFDKLDMTGKKGVLVDVYTDWCGWCKVMDKQTFTDPEIQKALNENFHVVKHHLYISNNHHKNGINTDIFYLR